MEHNFKVGDKVRVVGTKGREHTGDWKWGVSASKEDVYKNKLIVTITSINYGSVETNLPEKGYDLMTFYSENLIPANYRPRITLLYKS